MPLRRVLDEKHSISIDHYFPKTVQGGSGYRYRVLLGVGGNIGDVKRRMNHLMVYLQRLKLVCLVRSGVILRNPPFGYTEQGDFENTVIEIATSLQPRALFTVDLANRETFWAASQFCECAEDVRFGYTIL